MRFLFATIQGFESDFYGKVGAHLADRGHDVAHVAYSRRAARLLNESGHRVHCLRELLEEVQPGAVDDEVHRIEEQYGLPTIRDAYSTDSACEGRPEKWCVERSVRHFLALERVFDQVEPDVLVPEVGCELIRTVSHLVALDRGVRTLFLFYTIFPDPLRLYVDTMQAPIVAPDELRPLAPEEHERVERFRSDFIGRGRPIRAHRRHGVTRRRLSRLRMYAEARFGDDRDNEYLRPGSWIADHVREPLRRFAAMPLYRHPDGKRRSVYFPLHVTDDYKIRRVIPQWMDQAAVVDQLADSLPPGYDLVLKEHPMSIGCNPIGLLRRLARRRNVRLVPPSTSSHDLIRESDAVAVISSTVGLEALLYDKPVLTMGRPFYADYGITIDVESLAEVRRAVVPLLRFRPDREQIDRFLHAAMQRCYPGAPVLVDDSDENARLLAQSLDAAAGALAPSRRTDAALA